MTGTVRVGISGWTYLPWRGVFYPPGLRQNNELEYAASQMSSIEINGSFYSLQRPDSYKSWAERTPDEFVFAVKGGRFITHMKKLANAETPLAIFFASGLLALGDKLGPILWQLPPTLGFDVDRLVHFFDQLPRTTVAAAELARGHDERVEGRAWLEAVHDRPIRHALEVRHASFLAPEFLAMLRAHDVAVVVADTALDEWATLVRGWAEQGTDVYVYFDNDMLVRAPFDAIALAERLADLAPRRVCGTAGGDER